MAGVRQVLVQTLLITGKREFILKESQNFICGLKPKKEYLIFSLFFSPKFDIKRKSKHLFFVCFQEQLLKLKYSIELRKSKFLSTFIFHHSFVFLRKRTMLVWGKVASFTETIYLSQRVLFWEGDTCFFFRKGSWNYCSLTWITL